MNRFSATFPIYLAKKDFLGSEILFLNSFENGTKLKIQCNLDLVTLLVSVKTVTKSHNVTKSNDFM